MIYVWAYEQGDGSKRKMGKRAKASSSSTLDATGSPAVDGLSIGLEQTNLDGTREEKSKADEEKVQDVLVPWVYQPKSNPAQPDQPEAGTTEPQVFHRYYHLFVEGELRKLVEEAAKEDGYRILETTEDQTLGEGKWVRIRGVGWEADNWWIEGEVGL